MVKLVRYRARQAGFSLLELSLVLIILGFITGSSVVLGISQLEKARTNATQKKLDTIETALLAFRMTNGRLPCPADLTLTASSGSFGKMVGSAGSCSGANFGPSNEVVEGAVPVRDLYLSDEFAYDGWGRKIAYAVDRRMTAINSFDRYPINQSCGNVIVNDVTGTQKSNGALYALISFGPNGHGGYLQSTVRNDANSTNTNELKNCHCDGDGVAATYDGTYVQSDITQTTTAGDTFDDTVRYKERWQLQSVDDNVRTNDNYYGVELIVGSASSQYLHTYNILCEVPTLVTRPSSLPPGSVNSVAFSKDNSYVISGNGVLSPYINLYKRAGMTLSRLSSQPDVQPSSQVNALTISTDTHFLAAGTEASPYLYLYRRVGDGFERLDDADVMPTAKVHDVIFSPQSIHLAVAQQKSGNRTLLIYRHDGNEFVQISSQPDFQPQGNNAYGLSFSFDSLYLAVGSDSAPYLTIYLRYLESFFRTSEPSSGPPGVVYDTEFSQDATYLAVAHDASPYITIYKRSGETFTKLASPSSLPPSTAYGVSFSADAFYLAVSHVSSPYVTVYKRQGDTFTKISDPDVLPGSTGLSVSFRNRVY